MSAYSFTFSGGIYSIGEVIEWELYESDGVTLITSGLINSLPLSFSIDTTAFPDFNPDENCYLLKWRKNCPNGISTDWQEKQFGYCNPEIAMNGILSMYSSATDQCHQSAFTRLRFRFPAPTPAQIDIQIAYVVQFTCGFCTGVWSGAGGDMLPIGHPDKVNAGSGTDSGGTFDFSIPAGSTDWINPAILCYHSPLYPVDICMVSIPVCNPVHGNFTQHKIYYKVVNPVGLILNLTAQYDTPPPFNTKPGGILTLQQIV